MSQAENLSEPSPSCNVASHGRAEGFEQLALEALRNSGFRVTSPRLMVIRALGETNRPLSANEIHARITASRGRIDPVSIYRILSTLQSVGAVHRIGVVDAFYACGLHAHSVHDTQHFVCEACGCVSELDVSEGARSYVDSASQKLGFTPSEIHFEILGLCGHCQKEGSRLESRLPS